MASPDLSLEGKTAVVTGARRGIGRAIALTLAAAGADVVIADYRIEGGEAAAVAEEIRSLGRRSLVVAVDVTEKAAVDDLVARTVAEFGGIDILVNNAGVGVGVTEDNVAVVTGETAPSAGSTRLGRGTGWVPTPEDVWDRVVDTSLKGSYLCSQAVIAGMIEHQRGNIISLSSIMATRTSSFCISYGSAKAGIVMLTRGLAIDLGRHNIRVNAIAPGFVRTDMIASTWSNPDRLQAMEERIPLGKLADPNQIANVALFLASDVASYVTGQTITVDGGIFLNWF